MLQRILDITKWHWIIVFAGAGLCAIGLAFSTVNLFQHTMANLAFIRLFGLLAIQEGALIQLGELIVTGGVALVCYLGFKFCEVELSIRFRRWATNGSQEMSDPRSPDVD